MVGIDDAEAAPLAGRHRAQPHRASVCASIGTDGVTDDPRVDDVDDVEVVEVVEGPDDIGLDTVTRLMGFLRGDDQPA
jgi:hypothetical protein